MLSKYSGTAVCIFNKNIQNYLPLTLGSINNVQDRLPLVRYINKHWDPKWKKYRREKVIKIEVPDFHEKRKQLDEMTPDEIRAEMKKKGIEPVAPWQERVSYITTSGTILEPYVPPEGDGRFSTISKEGAKQRLQVVEKKGKSMMAIRTTRKYDDTFETKDFLNTALDVYKKAHETLANNKDDLKLYVTEKAIPEILHNAETKTIYWKFVESLEPARIVHARMVEMMSKDFMFSQITVRFHTQQILAIYDRFGRLMYGSEILKKDVLEYVVFEKLLTNPYGTWRVHGKIVPPWMPPRDVTEKTFIKPIEEPEEPETPSAVDAVPETAAVAEIKDEQPRV